MNELLLTSALLLAASLGFAFSMGAHYTGACMGMPHAVGAIRARTALLLMAPLAFVGAAFASGGVESTVAHGILPVGSASVGLVLAIVTAAFALTTLYNAVRIPTSTIQILVFSAVGAGLADGIPVDWSTIGLLVGLWAVAPFAALVVGYLAARLLPPFAPTSVPSEPTLPRLAMAGLIGVGAVASFAMGANDVANASGGLVLSGLLGLVAAGAVGGVGLAVGVLTWGRPLLRRVAFDIVRLDARTAIAAQLGQALVVLVFVTFGYFTSMNQALVGAMVGAGVARGETRVSWRTVRSILIGWLVGPLSGAACAFALVRAFALPGVRLL